jgi:amidohydrolase
VDRLVKFLTSNTSLEVVRKDGWLYAVKYCTTDAPPIALRADMDALPIDERLDLPYRSQTPGVSHKCGHDGHCAALCGAAIELSSLRIPRTTYLIFQPAEEIGLGAKHCAKLIEEKGIEEIYAFHNLSGYPEGQIVYRKGLTQPASEGLMIKLHGRHSHASAPEEGLNPASAVAQIALYSQNLLQEMQGELTKKAFEEGRDRVEMILCTIVGMKVGTGDFGISAGDGEIRLTLRAEDESVMKRMEERLRRYAQSLAEKEGLRFECAISDYFPETRNHDSALQKVYKCAQNRGFETCEMQDLWRASEDFGYYLKKCEGAMFYIGNGESYPALHTAEYDFNDRILDTAVDMFVSLAASEL